MGRRVRGISAGLAGVLAVVGLGGVAPPARAATFIVACGEEFAQRCT